MELAHGNAASEERINTVRSKFEYQLT